MNNGIKCGHCGDRHASVDEVKACMMERATAAAVIEQITERQLSYLTDLVKSRVIPDELALIKDANLSALDKKSASKAIDILSKQPKRQQGMTIPETIPDGRYAYLHEELGKIVFYRVVTSRDGFSRRVQKVLGSPGDFRYINVTGTEAANAIKAIEPDPGLASQLFGHAVGACGVCGSPLTDPESIRLGIGPICAKKYDW